MPFRGVLIFATGYHQSLVPQRYRDVLLFKKEFDPKEVAKAMLKWDWREKL
jgi:hypothetical protein